MPRVDLTERQVAKLAKTPGCHWVSRNLYLDATSGASWTYRYMIDGAARAMGLGAYRDYTLAEARERARQARRLANEAIDPIAAAMGRQSCSTPRDLAGANGTAALTLEGALDDSAELAFKLKLDKMVAARPTRFVLRMEDLQTMSDMYARLLAFNARRLDIETKVFIVGATDRVKGALQRVGLLEEATVVDDIAEIEGA